MELFSFITSEKYEEAFEILQQFEKRGDLVEDISEIDHAEALESMGIIEFYNGQFEKAVLYLSKSLDHVSVIKRRQPRRIGIIHLLLGSSKVRLGDILKGIEHFLECYQISRSSSNFDLAAIASANQAIGYCKLKKYHQSIDLCKQAMEIVAKMNSTTCFEYLQYARTLISIYIKSGDFQRAEKLVEEIEFSDAERCLLEAGIDFARGKIDKSMKRLQGFRIPGQSNSIAIVPPMLHHLKPTYSNSSLLASIEEGNTPLTTNPNSAAPSRLQSRAHSQRFDLKDKGLMFEDDILDDGEYNNGNNNNKNNQEQEKLDEFSYGDEHLRLMENSLPSFMKQMEKSINHIMIEYNKALLTQRFVPGNIPHGAISTLSSSFTVTSSAHKASPASKPSPGGAVSTPTAAHLHPVNTPLLPSASQIFDYPLKLITEFIESLQQIKTKHTENQVNPYLSIPYGDYHPTIIPQDYYLFPMVLSLIMMITQYEYQFIYHYYEKDGLLLEKGQFIPLKRSATNSSSTAASTRPGTADSDQSDGKKEMVMGFPEGTKEDENDELKKLENQFLQIISLLESFTILLPTKKHPAATAATDHTATKKKKLKDQEDPDHPEKDDFLLPKNQILHQLTDTPDLSISKEIVKTIQQFLSLRHLASRPMHSSAAATPPPSAGLPGKANNLLASTTVSMIPANLSSSATKESIEILGNHNIQLDPSTARLIEPNKPSTNKDGTPAATDSSHPPSRAKGSSRNPSIARNSVAPPRRSMKAPSISSLAVLSSSGLGSAALVLNPIQQYPTNQYIPMIKDRLSYYSEIIYNLDSFGRDELSSWITYALTSLSGVSIGYLGNTVLDGADVFRFLEETFTTIPPSTAPAAAYATVPPSNPSSRPPTSSEAPNTTTANSKTIENTFLYEIRNRLLEIEAKLTVSPLLFYDYNIDLLQQSPFQMMNSGITGGNTTGGKDSATPASSITEDYQYLSFRILLLILLIKITVQLSMKQEINTYLITLEKLTKVLYSKYHLYSMEVIIYYAIAMKYRCEYEEWCIPCNEFNTLPTSFYTALQRQPSSSLPSAISTFPQIVPISPHEYLKTLCFTILPWYKKYYQITKESGNIVFMKDAIKKLINLFIMISNLPINIQQMMVELQSSTSTASTGSISTNNNGGREPVMPLMKELEALDEQLIEEYEQQDVVWVYRFAKLRALQFMKIMKDLGKESLFGGGGVGGLGSHHSAQPHHQQQQHHAPSTPLSSLQHHSGKPQ